jgi:transcriptional regulator GlxA family with amidase domain
VSPARAIDVVFVVYDGIQALDVTGPWEVFFGANQVLDAAGASGPRYSLHLASSAGGDVTSESGLSVRTVPIASVPPPHTLVLPGGFGSREAAGDDELIADVRRLASHAHRVVSVCTGSFVAAAAGLADGKRVATHWARASKFQRQFPDVQVDAEPIYVRDGNLWSSAGVTAGIDLALAIVEHDHDADVAQVVARWLVMFLRRPGGQTQFATPVWSERAETAPVRAAQELVDAEPGADHRVGALAARVGMSERHFTRCFTAEVGTSPGRYITSVRVESARRALETSDDTVDTIAARCGFGTAETMRRAFARRLGVSPDQYRQRFRRSHR